MNPEMLVLPTAEGPMRVFRAIPEGARRGGVVVVQEAFGLNAHIEDVTRRLAAVGFVAVAPDLYHRTADPGPFDYDDFTRALAGIETLSDDAMLDDVDAALAHLASLGVADAQTGIVGFCMGGRVTFLVAARRTLGAAVGFYGGGIVTARRPTLPSLVQEGERLATPWLGLFGDLDRSIPIDDVERLRDALRVAPVATDVVRYADADHGFFCDRRGSYAPAAAADAWLRTLSWFQRLDAR